MTADLEALVDKGRRSLTAARRDFDAGDHDLAVSRGYYDQFVSQGVFAPDLHVALGRAFSERTISDYRYEQRVTAATARGVLDDATRFVEEVAAYLRRVGGA